MTSTETDGGCTIASCPFDTEQLEASKSRAFGHRYWRNMYASASDGAKKGLDVFFWFACNKEWLDGQPVAEHDKYIRWRDDVDNAMTREELEFMANAIIKNETRERYKRLLKDRFGVTWSRKPSVECEFKLMSYGDFFWMLDALGEFNSYSYNEDTKRSLIEEFVCVLKGSSEPLKTHVEDMLATAKLKDVRVYPQGGVTYVRMELQFLTATAEWSRPYQMLAAWDSAKKLKGYAFPVGKGRRTEVPYEMEDPPNAAQRNKRRLLKADRLAR